MYLRLILDKNGVHRYLPPAGPADSFDSLSLQLRVAIPDIRAQCPAPYIQEIQTKSKRIAIQLDNTPVDIHRPRDAKIIYIVSGDGIFGPVHNIRPVALLLRTLLLNMLKNLAVLRGICNISQSSELLFSSANIATVLDQAKASFISSVAHFLHQVGALRAMNHSRKSAMDMSDDFSRNHISMLHRSGLWLATTRPRKDVEYATETLGSLITIRSKDLQAAIPNPREQPDWDKRLVDDRVGLNEFINKDAAIAIAHNEKADNPWRHAFFKDMSPSRAIRTQGRMIHRHLQNPDTFLEELQSNLNMEPESSKQLLQLDEVCLVIGTSSLLLDSGAVTVHDHKRTCETANRVAKDMIIRTTTTKEVDITIETLSVSAENQYCFALQVLKVEMGKGLEEAEKLAMSLKYETGGKLLEFEASKDTPSKPTAQEGRGADPGAGTSSAVSMGAHTHGTRDTLLQERQSQDPH